MDGVNIDLKTVLKGDAYSIDQLFDDDLLPGREVKLIIKNGAQMKLEDLEEVE